MVRRSPTLRASSLYTRTPLDVFRSGVAECSAVNNLIGAMLEMNGLRYRLVAGFNPKFRVSYPLGGHSAIEVFDSASESWSYVDSYLDILLPGVSTEALARMQDDSAQPFLSPPRQQDASAQMRERPLRIGEVFKYRNYGDQLGRLPMISMLRLRAGHSERDYGLDWDLNTVAPRPAPDLGREPA